MKENLPSISSVEQQTLETTKSWLWPNQMLHQRILLSLNKLISGSSKATSLEKETQGTSTDEKHSRRLTCVSLTLMLQMLTFYINHRLRRSMESFPRWGRSLLYTDSCCSSTTLRSLRRKSTLIGGKSSNQLFLDRERRLLWESWFPGCPSLCSVRSFHFLIIFLNFWRFWRTKKRDWSRLEVCLQT